MSRKLWIGIDPGSAYISAVVLDVTNAAKPEYLEGFIQEVGHTEPSKAKRSLGKLIGRHRNVRMLNDDDIRLMRVLMSCFAPYCNIAFDVRCTVERAQFGQGPQILNSQLVAGIVIDALMQMFGSERVSTHYANDARRWAGVKGDDEVKKVILGCVGNWPNKVRVAHSPEVKPPLQAHAFDAALIGLYGFAQAALKESRARQAHEDAVEVRKLRDAFPHIMGALPE